MNYIIVDTMNMFMRARHAAGKHDISTSVGMSMHILLNSVRKAWRDFSGDHVIFCLEGRSWRKDVYAPYKENRKVKAAGRSPREVENDEIFMKAFQDLITYLSEKTNCTVVQCPVAEADDLIATWIQTHPDDQHIILSSDSDFFQLLAPNVRQFDGVSRRIYSVTGVTDSETGKTVLDKKTKLPLAIPDPQFALFEKCVRGDTGDNIFSAYPGASLKGTKNRVGIQQAYADSTGRGYNYNNFMLQRWTDHEGKEHVVRDDYARNRELIDLTAQPEHIRERCIQALMEAKNRPAVPQVGVHFMRFCGAWDLKRLSDAAADYAQIFNARATIE